MAHLHPDLADPGLQVSIDRCVASAIYRATLAGWCPHQLAQAAHLTAEQFERAFQLNSTTAGVFAAAAETLGLNTSQLLRTGYSISARTATF